MSVQPTTPSDPQPFWKLIQASRFPVITTRQTGDVLHTRPVAMCNRDGDSLEFLWFLMPRSSESVEDMLWDSAVGLIFAPQAPQSYIAAFGSAVVIEDVSLKRRFWSSMQDYFPDAPAWFPSGVDSSSVALIRVKIIRADCWDTEQNAVTRLFSLAPPGTPTPNRGGGGYSPVA